MNINHMLYRRRPILVVTAGLYFIFVLLCSLGQAKMTVDWMNEDVDMAVYEELYIYNIDLRGITYEIYDDEESDYEPERLDDHLLGELALELYDHFFVQLKDVISINEDQDVKPTEKSLILNLVLSAHIEVHEQGALAKRILGDSGIESMFHIKCNVLDGTSKKTIFVIKDEHVLKSPQSDSPLSSKEERDALTNMFRVWATKFSKVFSQAAKKNH